MFSSLHAQRRLVAVASLGACLISLAGAMASAETSASAALRQELTATTLSIEPAGQPVADNQIAHHGGESTGTAASMVGATVATPALGVLTGQAHKHSYSDSLWGNMLLNMAYQRDTELQKLITKLGRLNSLTMLSVLGVTGLGLGQSIYSFNQTTEAQTVDVTPAHHAGGEDHVHIPAERFNKVPSTLGIIGSSVTLGTLGVRAVMGKAYTHKLAARQEVIRGQIDSILDRMEQGAQAETVQGELTALVGARATGEFLLLWKAVHPAPAATAMN